MKYLLFCCLVMVIIPVSHAQIEAPPHKKQINHVLDAWHAAASAADFEAYFSRMAEDAIFIGTVPTEKWKKNEFAKWAKPYFDQGTAWDFEVLQRTLYTKGEEEIVWFDELLDTSMGICRGSGVVAKNGDSWKIVHYVLSMTIPNKDVEAVNLLKKDFDAEFKTKINKSK